MRGTGSLEAMREVRDGPGVRPLRRSTAAPLARDRLRGRVGPGLRRQSRAGDAGALGGRRPWRAMTPRRSSRRRHLSVGPQRPVTACATGVRTFRTALSPRSGGTTSSCDRAGTDVRRRDGVAPESGRRHAGRGDPSPTRPDRRLRSASRGSVTGDQPRLAARRRRSRSRGARPVSPLAGARAAGRTVLRSNRHRRRRPAVGGSPHGALRHRRPQQCRCARCENRPGLGAGCTSAGPAAHRGHCRTGPERRAGLDP
ncbi:hypothetical protein STENM327S_07249 [Streptomyces tendae]